MEDDKNPFDQFDQTAPVAPARPVLSVRPLGTGVKAPAPQTPVQAQIDVQDLENKKLSGQKLAMDAASPSSEAQQANRRKAALESIVNQINRVQELYNTEIHDGGIDRMFAGAIGAFPTSENRQFDSAGAALAEQGLSAFRVPGVGSQSDTELRQFVEANRPLAGDYNASIEEKLLALRSRVDTERQSLGLPPAQWANLPVVQGAASSDQRQTSPNAGPTILGAPPPASPNGGDLGGPIPDGDPTAPDDPGTAQITTAPIKFSTEQDKRVSAVLQTILDRGGSVDEANQVLRQYGYTSPIGSDSWNSAVQYNKSRPKGAPKAKVVPPETGTKDISNYQKAVGAFASSSAGAATIGALNGISAGTIDEIGGGIDALVSGRPLDEAIADANLKKQLVRDASPTAYGIGEIGGGVAGSLGAGRLVGGGLRGAAGLFAPRAIAADVAYGGAYGAGENNDNRVGGGVAGALISAGGGVAGRGLARGLATAVAPKVSDAVRFLRDRGVRTSLGETLGGTAQRMEERIAGFVPGVTSSLKRAETDFNRAYADDALKELAPFGNVPSKLPADIEIGADSMKFGQKAFDDAYDQARARMSLRPDAQYVQDLDNLTQRVTQGSPGYAPLSGDEQDALRKIFMSNVAKRMSASGINGTTYKEISSDLGKIAAKRGKTSPELADAVRDLQGIIDNAARRSSPPEAAALLDAADRGYARWIRGEMAANSAGDTGRFTAAQLDRAIRKADPTVRSRAYLRGEALGQEWAEAGKQVLKSNIPNSGTPERLAAQSLLGGGVAGAAHFFNPAAAIPYAGVSAAYAPGLRNAIPAMLTRKSSPAAQAVANAIRERARLAGAATSPLLLAYQGGGQ